MRRGNFFILDSHIFDFVWTIYRHHASFLPSEHPSEHSHYLDRILAIWKARGIKPKMHYSESRPGAKSVSERRAHSDRVKIIPSGMPEGDLVDLMIEGAVDY
jgi:UV DNA damage endonuclease